MRGKILFISLVTLLFLTIPHPALSDTLAQLKEAGMLVKNKQYQQAEAIYKQIVTAFPDTNEALEAQKQLTCVYIATDRQQEADAAFEKLITGFSKHKNISEAVWLIAKRYNTSKKYEKAIEINQYNVEHFPKDIHAMWSQMNIIRYYISNGNEPAADAAFDKLLTVFSDQPTLPEEVWRLAKMYSGLKRNDRAFELYQYNVEHFPKDIHAMWSQMDIIRAYISNGNEPAGNAAFDKLLAVFSQQPTLPEEVWRIAKMYSRLKRDDKAFELYQYNVEHFPKDIHAMWSQMDIIRSYITDGNEPAADAAFNKLLTVFSQQPTLPEEVWRIAKMYSELERNDKAFELYQYNVEHFPKDIHAMWSQMNIIRAYITDGNEPAADAVFDKLLAVFSDQPTLPNEVYRIADLYGQTGRYNKANGLYQKALQLYQYVIDIRPNSEQMILAKAGVARSNIALGNEAAAEAVVNELIADFNDEPNLPQAIFLVGEEYYNKAFVTENEGQQAESKAYFRKAIAMWEKIIKELPPFATTPEAYHFSGCCYERLGEYEKSVEYYQIVVDRWPKYEYAWSAQFLIARCYEELANSGRIPAADAAVQICNACNKVLANYPGCMVVTARSLLTRWNSVALNKGGDK